MDEYRIVVSKSTFSMIMNGLDEFDADTWTRWGISNSFIVTEKHHQCFNDGLDADDPSRIISKAAGVLSSGWPKSWLNVTPMRYLALR